MTFLRIFLIAAFVSLLIYTSIAVNSEGWILADVFIADLAALNWSGQFNLDFLTYLWLSAIWIAWRHNFSAVGIVFALIASVGGMLFFAIYLLVVTYRCDGNVEAVLLGARSSSN